MHETFDPNAIAAGVGHEDIRQRASFADLIRKAAALKTAFSSCFAGTEDARLPAGQAQVRQLHLTVHRGSLPPRIIADCISLGGATCYNLPSGDEWAKWFCGEPMADYRLYCLDGTTRHITEGEWISAVSDDEAVAAACALAKPVPCELWLGDRLVAKIPVSQG